MMLLTLRAFLWTTLRKKLEPEKMECNTSRHILALEYRMLRIEK